MTYKEYAASYIYWLPRTKIRQYILYKFFDSRDYERIRNIYENENSIYWKVTRDTWGISYDNKVQVVNEASRDIHKDNEFRKVAIRKITSNLFRHILATFQFAWRGIFIEHGYILSTPFLKYVMQEANLILILNPILFLCFFYLFILSIVKKVWNIFIFFLPTFYLYFTNSFFTIGTPRFNIPMIPYLIMAFLIVIYYFSKRILKIKIPDNMCPI